MPDAPKKCQGKCGRFTGPCWRKPSVVRDGSHYCWQHDPERLKAAREERQKARRQETAATEARIEAEVSRRVLIRDAGMEPITDDDLRAVIQAGGFRSLLKKAAAFDQLANALTNQWWDGSWTWWNPTPSCGMDKRRATREEAVEDLVAWAERTAARNRRKALATTGTEPG